MALAALFMQDLHVSLMNHQYFFATVLCDPSYLVGVWSCNLAIHCIKMVADTQEIRTYVSYWTKK